MSACMCIYVCICVCVVCVVYVCASVHECEPVYCL